MTIRETLQKRIQADVQRKADIAAYQKDVEKNHFVAQLKLIMPELADEPDELPAEVDGLTLDVELNYGGKHFKIIVTYDGETSDYYCFGSGRGKRVQDMPDYYPTPAAIRDFWISDEQAKFADHLVKIGYLDEAVPADPNPAAVAWSPPLTEPVQPYSNPELTERIATFREAAWGSYQSGGDDTDPFRLIAESDGLIRDMQAELERLAKLVEEAND